LVFKGELLERVGVSFPTIWSWMRKGEFPRARVVGGQSAWLSSEIDAWIAALPVRRYKDDPDA
jgi:predicted DNA-binding transcriptional regulator AlpA